MRNVLGNAKFWWNGIYVFTFLTCLVSCHSPVRHDKIIFRYNETDGIASLDPAFAKNRSVMWPVHQLFNTLVEVDDQLQVKPSLALRWEFSTDKKEIRFHLRDDVFFHDDACFPQSKGRKLVAADVVYSFNRIINPATASPGAWIFNDRISTNQPFMAIGDSVFVLNLNKPFQPLLGMLSMQYCSVVAPEAVVYYGSQFRRHPVGSGPFRFLSWEEGQALILQRNPGYFETDSLGKRLPYLDGIKVSFFENKSTEFLEFKQGRLDFVNDFDPSFKDEILTRTGTLKAKWEQQWQLHKHPYLNTEYLGILSDSILMKESPLRFLKVRQAINHAIDRKKLILYLRNSIGTAAMNGFVPVGLPGFDTAVKGYDYNPAKVRALLQSAGYDQEHPMPTITLLTIPNYAAIGSYIVNELQQAGIPARVEAVQKSLLLDQTSKLQARFFRGSWLADYPDAENYLGVFYSRHPAPPNYTRYSNPQFDLLYEKAIAETNDSTRYILYRQMDQMVIADAPVVPLWYDMVIHLVHKNIVGFRPNALNMLELRKVKRQ